LHDKSADELSILRQEVENSIAGAADNAALAGGMMGQKLIKRFASDLDAIRKKYFTIKGSPDDQLSSLHRLQGREQQLVEELLNLVSAEKVKLDLGSDLELITMMIGDKKKEVRTR
jgi:ABC-type xylose transport system substrate-binding protein